MMIRRASLYWSIVALFASTILALLWVVPLLWAASTALRPEHEAISAVFHWLPQTWTVDSFASVLSAGNLPRWMFNSVLVSLLVTTLTMAVSITAAYAFSQIVLQ